MSNTVLLKGELGRRYEEKYASGAITPGMLIKTNSSGEWTVHATAGGVWERAVAWEDALSGPDGVNTRGNTIDDAYADDDLVRGSYLAPGEIFNALLIDGGTAVVKGSPITSNGDGCVKLATGSDVVIGWADDAVDNSAGSDPVRVPVLVA